MSQRLLLTMALGLLTARGAAAQEAGEADEPPSIPVVKLATAPAAAPVPALRYQLLPELRNTSPGNAALLYYRAFAPDWISPALRPETTQALDDAQAKPMSELKTKAGAAAVEWVRTSTFLAEVDRAARRQYCDWDLVSRTREDGIAMLLPDVQSLRQFSRMLAVRARLELAAGDFDKATYTLQTGFALGRHTADAPTLIQALVGMAAATTMLAQVEEFIRTPGAPNLYWALSTLPHPYIDLRKGYQGERMVMDNLLPGFRETLGNPAAVPLSLQQAEEIGDKVARVYDQVPSKMILAAHALKNYAPAKEFLRRRGWKDEQIAALPVLQAVFLYEIAEYDQYFDEFMKWQGQPYEVQRRGLDEADQGLRRFVGGMGGPGLSLAAWLLPAVHKVSNAQARLDRRICGLRCVEAVRLYAAAHGGQMPATLAAITDVPIPNDPLTGKPFGYAVSGRTATLTAPPPDREAPNSQNSFQYEITLGR